MTRRICVAYTWIFLLIIFLATKQLDWQQIVSFGGEFFSVFIYLYPFRRNLWKREKKKKNKVTLFQKPSSSRLSFPLSIRFSHSHYLTPTPFIRLGNKDKRRRLGSGNGEFYFYLNRKSFSICSPLLFLFIFKTTARNTSRFQ